MKAKFNGLRWLLVFSMLLMAIGNPCPKYAGAAGEKFRVSVSRVTGQCTFTISNFSAEDTGKQVVVEVANKETKKVKLTKKFTVESDTISGGFSISDLKYAYAVYTVTAKISEQVAAGGLNRKKGSVTTGSSVTTASPATTGSAVTTASPATTTTPAATAPAATAPVATATPLATETPSPTQEPGEVRMRVIGNAKECDFSIHTKKIDFSVTGNNSDAKRSFYLNSTEPSGGVLVPGENNKVTVYVWTGTKGKETKLGSKKALGGSSIQWENLSIANVTTSYGKWNAKVVLTNKAWKKGRKIVLASTKYTVEPSLDSLVAEKSAALEKNQKFKVALKGLKNARKVKAVVFQIYSSKGSKLAEVTAKSSSSNYTAEVGYEQVKYKLEKLKIKAVMQDDAGTEKVLSKTAKVNLSVKNGKTKVKKNKDRTYDVTLTKAYVPGNIKKVEFAIYRKNGSKYKKKAVYEATGSAAINKYAKNIEVDKAGDYMVYTYVYTAWDKKLLLAKTAYEITKDDLGKQGWIYEKVNGKKYKFYYVDGVKQTDVTKVLGLSANGNNKMNIEVNRAAGVVTFYLYNEETKQYDIPIRSAAVSVGRDIRTVAGAGALNIQSSFTPIGNFSVCSNGTAVRYSLKPMHEPDGSTVYARWCTHIVGNVYFHSIAVSAQSHYALSARSYNRLGTPASAGCIRMTVADAKWLYTYVPTGTRVNISVGSSSKPGPFGKPSTIKINGVSYDPTDPEVPDSRKKQDYNAKRITGYMTKDGKKVGY